MFKKVVKFIKNNKALTLVLFMYVAIICIPLLNQGVLCNDELQYRFQSFGGIRSFFKYWISVQTYEKGRFISAIPTTIYLYIGFASTNRVYERVVAIAVFLLCIGLLAQLWQKLFNNKFFTLLFLVLSIGFIPITFEPVTPNSYVTLFCLPAIFMIMAWRYYIEFLENKNKKKLAISMGLLFVSLISYEIFVTYVPIFLFIAFYKSNEKTFGGRIIESIKEFMAPLLCAIIFLIMYVITGKIFASNYAGTQIGNFTLSSSLAIIRHLFASSIPGYFLFNKKYQYLFNIYAPNGADTFCKTLFKNIDICVILLVILAIIIIFKITNMKQEENRKEKSISHVLILLVAFLYMILPSIPNSISSMYQGCVNENNFIQLPVTLFLYFACCFFIAYLISWIRDTILKKYILVPIYVLLLLVMMSVQTMNITFSNQQNIDYERMIRIENLFDTWTMSKFNNKTVYSQDIYQTKNCLAINDGYWTQYAVRKGLLLQIEQNLDEKQQEDYTLNYIEDMYFTLQNDDNLLVFLQNNDLRDKAYVDLDDFSIKVNLSSENMMTDGKFKVFYFRLQNGQVVANNPSQFCP